jgi:hypothetical protein
MNRKLPPYIPRWIHKGIRGRAWPLKEKNGRCLWLFGIFASGPRADDMVNGFREMDARFPAHENRLSRG